MAKLAGKAGAVSYDTGTEILGIKSWTLDYVSDALETTDFVAAGVRSYIVGCSSWSGSFEGYKDGAPPAITGSIYNASFLEADTAGYCWTGSVLFTGIHPSVSFDGVVSYTWDFQGTGALTIASV
uniref:Putative tail protein n=1 Tax=viral metagenome TaxID=1070528 RepID=A0A6M3KZ58_9ZZZZ